MSSKAVLLGAGVVLLLAGAIAGYLYGVDSTPTKTTRAGSITTTTLTTTFTASSTSLDAYEQVSSSFASHMLFLSERNPFAVVSQYEENAAVTWNGKLAPGGLVGFYNGTGLIFLLMNASFSSGSARILGPFSIGNVTHTVVDISADSAVVNSSFDISGRNISPQVYNLGFPYIAVASFNGTVSAQDSYVYSASQGAWLISTETWNFLNFTFQYPTSTTG